MTAIPEELKTLRRWHNWRDVDGTKIPIQVNGNAAKSNDPTTWTDFETADAFGMLAFELGDGYAGVDLDNCLDVFGELRSWAWKIVDRFDGVAYMEISPSGRGIKFITRGAKPAGSRCVHKIGDDKQQIECYDKTRFWTVTGNVYNRQREIGDGQEALDWLCGEYLTPVAPSTPTLPAPFPAGSVWTSERRRTLTASSQQDRAVGITRRSISRGICGQCSATWANVSRTTRCWPICERGTLATSNRWAMTNFSG
jgi:hypothetical protein